MSLGRLELQVMISILRQQGEAYGVSIADDLEKRTGKVHSTGAIYTTLDRLRDKKFVVSRLGESTFERGGRAKMYFSLTGLGQSEVDAALSSFSPIGHRIRTGLAPERGSR